MNMFTNSINGTTCLLFIQDSQALISIYKLEPLGSPIFTRSLRIFMKRQHEKVTILKIVWATSALEWSILVAIASEVVINNFQTLSRRRLSRNKDILTCCGYIISTFFL